MKKLISITLIIILVFTVAIGCSKKENTSQDTQKQHNDEVNNGTDIQDENEDKGEEIEDVEYVLYIRYKSEPFIESERFTIPNNDNRLKEKLLEQIALEHLMNFGGFGELISPIPEDTKLLNFTKEDGLITVDFSQEFVNNMKYNEYNTAVSVAAIVNTLTVFNNDLKVIFKVDGNELIKLNGVDMNKKFKYSDEFFIDK